MKIVPINNNIYSGKKYFNSSPKYSLLKSFTGRPDLTRPGFLKGLKSAIAKFAAPAGTVFTVPALLPDSRTDNAAERNNLYLELNTDIVSPKLFFDFYNTSPQLARTVVKSGRRVTDFDIVRLNDLKSYNLSDNQYEALGCILGAKYINNRPVFSTGEITATYIDALDESTSIAIINNREKLDNIFSSIHSTLNAGKDYFDTAVVLNSSKDLGAEEMQQYFEVMSEYDLSALQAWAGCDISVRQEVLHQISENKYLEPYLEKYYSAIIPSENLLRKFELITDFEKNGESLENILKSPQDILDSVYDADNIKKGISRIKSLPPEMFQNVCKTYMGDIIVHYETLKDIGSVQQSTPVEDYIWIVENTELLSDELREALFNSERIFSLPLLTDDNKASFGRNAALLNRMSGKDINIPGYNILDILLNRDAEDNYRKAEHVINDSVKDILKEIEYKCRDTNPVFVDIARKYLSNKDNISSLLLIPDINKESIVDNFFQVSKIRAAIAKAPEKYLNNTKDNFSDLELCFLQKYLELGNKDVKAAKEFFDTLNSSMQEKFFLVATSIDYNNIHYMNILYSALAVTDAEYMNMLLAKRLNKFRMSIGKIYNLPYNFKSVINKLIRHGKNRNEKGEIIKLSGRQKELIIDYIPAMQKTLGKRLDSLIEKYSEPVGRKQDFVFDLEGFITEYSRIVFEKLGYDNDLHAKYAQSLGEWDKNYIHHLLLPNSRDTGELKLVFDLVTRGTFNEYISNPFTPHGQSNKQTKDMFGIYGINFDVWLKGIEPENIACAGNIYTIKLLDRSAKNMLFMGNYTSCCTALNEEKGDSVPNYLLNTAFNVIEIVDKNGKIAATSRIFMSTDVNDEPFLVVDNIEVSNKFRATLNDDTSREFVKDVWKYIQKYAENLSDKHIPVYMSHKYPKIKLPDVPVGSRRIKLLGNTTKQKLYINTVGEHVNTRDSYVCDVLNIFNEPL